MNTNEKKVVTRFAPSPTGFLHIGGVRTAIFSYLYAKKMGGTFILRIEDTDKQREVAGSIEHIMESLRWLDIEWDYGPDKPGPFGSCIQSERLESYKKYAQQLIDKGLAYPDPYTKEEVEKFRQDSEVQKKPFLFRNYRPETFDVWDGTKPLRLKVPEVKRYVWQDAVRGQLEAGEEMLDDIVLIKSDGYPTYNFAHIIDDLEMGVTHIMRADEFIASQPKFLSIYDALEIPYPVFVSLPPILRDDRTKKLGKRDGAKDILDYRTEGYLPEAMFNFLTLIGWNPGTEKEVFTKDELIQEFDIQRIQKSGGAFNEEKLQWLNKEHLNRLSASEYEELVRKAIPAKITALSTFSEDRLKKLMPVLRERTHIMSDVTTAFEAGEYDFVFTDPDVSLDILRFKKDPDVESASPRLQHLAELLEKADFSSPDTIKSAVWDYAESEGRGEVLWPMRVALTGLERSPDPFTVAYIIGQTDTLRRLRSACDKIGHAE
ncbi:glutamate--tRNA ligase [Candidatus Kaiserbacteria bacterium CG10_big_fil_rev_8_21_14_0_10_44_10]|uniref:Glutamate--tRNA ligase n=1 Tax=Candidatus Kaiserbacteria bacterium CG10_big_fil_rev_8_21_14_0_10_44_10 TaxID=1974606 RepID=A0A2H0UJT8_9BACT|nr:MAG: glutamate--tRNA ligase [Candidatus Kaiserbacteria bacterium CG10_big_fil_rev_8_21_14_0_10_44_10]